MRAKSAAGAAAVLGVALVAGTWLTRRFQVTANPEAEILTLLHKTEQTGLQLAAPGLERPLVSSRHRFDRVTVTVDYAAGTALAVGTLDFVGRFGEVEVSSLGLERIPFRAVEDGWEATGPYAPRLLAIVTALAHRCAALQGGDAGALQRLLGGGPEPLQNPDLRRVLSVQQRVFRAKAWFIRSEREEALVTEDYHLSGQLPNRPVDEGGSRRLTLVKKEGLFLFWPALM